MIFADAIKNGIRRTTDAAKGFRRLAAVQLEEAQVRAKIKIMLIEKRREEVLEFIVSNPSKVEELIGVLSDRSLPVHAHIYAAQLLMSARTHGVDLTQHMPELEWHYLAGRHHHKTIIYLDAVLHGELREWGT